MLICTSSLMGTVAKLLVWIEQVQATRKKEVTFHCRSIILAEFGALPNRHMVNPDHLLS